MNGEPPKPPGRLRDWFTRRGTLISARDAKKFEATCNYFQDRAQSAVANGNLIKALTFQIIGFVWIYFSVVTSCLVLIPKNAVRDLAKLISRLIGNVRHAVEIYFLQRKVQRLQEEILRIQQKFAKK